MPRARRLHLRGRVVSTTPGSVIVLAIFETPSFTLYATGWTKHAAEAALHAGWRTHCERTGADRYYLQFHKADVRYITTTVGTAVLP